MGGFRYNDGGRAAANFKGDAGDCVTRAICIASGRPYAEVYEKMAAGNKSQRLTKHSRRHKITAGHRTANHGIWTQRKWFKDYMVSIGFRWVPTMFIGSGTTVHLNADELPAGRIICSVSRHYTAVIDGVVHDTFDPQREDSWEIGSKNGVGYRKKIGGRAVYGYWILEA